MYQADNNRYKSMTYNRCGNSGLEEGMATHSGILGWRILMDRGAWWVTVHGVKKSQT